MAAELFPENPLAAEVADLVARFGYRAVHIELDMHRPFRAVPSAPARNTDPLTSHEAGPRSADVSRFSSRSRQARLLHLFATYNLTDQEAALAVMGEHAAPSRLEGCRRRMSDLRAAGYVVDSGAKHCNEGSDDDAVVWTLSHAGERAIANLRETGWSR
jgi:hypothetical protein